MSRIMVLGAGGWGIGLALVAARMEHTVTLWSHDPAELDELRLHNQNRLRLPGVFLPHDICLTGELMAASEADMVVMAVPSFAIRATARKLAAYLRPDTVVVNAGKGLEDGTLERFSQVLEQELPMARIAVLSGPSHAEEVARKVPTLVTVSAKDMSAARQVQLALSQTHFRIYLNEDLIGVELGGALKNVIALCAGIVDGLGMGDNTKAALMTRGLVEIARLGKEMGAKETTFAGLSGMGDLMVTCGSMHSRNLQAGILIGRGETVENAVRQVGTVEGYLAARAAWELACRYKVDMPIVEHCYRVCYEGMDPRKALAQLMERPFGTEGNGEPLWMK
ncbi:MAG: NAD(P)-dependent glycerol-3-phosphate dehydrogenase [Clostridia bacterium]|nr:NAD(P)-dependent glycerol-3-phosphate dehydrogenase [Clostridia bacterium]